MEKYENSSPAMQKNWISKVDLQSAIEKLSEIEKSFEKVDNNQEEIKSWIFLKDIDLTKALDAIVYRAKIDNKLCDVKTIISRIEYGFDQLKCSQSDCFEKAIMCHKWSNDNPAKLYCDEHSISADQLSEGVYYLDAELRKDKSILISLERLIVVVQEQMEYHIRLFFSITSPSYCSLWFWQNVWLLKFHWTKFY